MKTRIISALLLTAFFAVILVCNYIFPIALNITVAVFSVACVYEIIKVCGLIKKYTFVVPSLAISVVVPFMEDHFIELFFIYALYSFILFIFLIFNHKQISFKNLSVIYSMSIMIPCAFLTLVSTRSVNFEYGIYFATMAVLAAWIPDMGAYFAGTFLGKHKLCPDISPKKTVEGLIGGSVISMIGVLVFGTIFAFIFYGVDVEINYIALLILGFGGSFTSVVGDLSFSLIKRSCGVKDFGDLIPGHGGMLDRFDSVIFTAPFAFFLIYTLPILT